MTDGQGNHWTARPANPQTDTETNAHLAKKSSQNYNSIFTYKVCPVHTHTKRRARACAHNWQIFFSLVSRFVVIIPFSFSRSLSRHQMPKGSLVSRRVTADSPIPKWLGNCNHFAINKVNGANENERRGKLTKAILKRKNGWQWAKKSPRTADNESGSIKSTLVMTVQYRPLDN